MNQEEVQSELDFLRKQIIESNQKAYREGWKDGFKASAEQALKTLDNAIKDVHHGKDENKPPQG